MNRNETITAFSRLQDLKAWYNIVPDENCTTLEAQLENAEAKLASLNTLTTPRPGGIRQQIETANISTYTELSAERLRQWVDYIYAGQYPDPRDRLRTAFADYVTTGSTTINSSPDTSVLQEPDTPSANPANYVWVNMSETTEGATRRRRERKEAEKDAFDIFTKTLKK